VNSSVEEIQPHELLSANPSEASGSSKAGQSSSDDSGLVNMQVSMALLPKNLDVDPGFLSLAVHRPINGHTSTDGIRLWARYFAPPGRLSGTLIPVVWQEFFISSLLNPTRFDWAQSFLNSEAWNIILKDNELERSLSFLLPSKCPLKRKIDCIIYYDDDKVEVAKSQQEKSVVNDFSTTSALHVKRRIIKAPLVVTDVRRSIRLEGKIRGSSVMLAARERISSAMLWSCQIFQGRQLEAWGRSSAKFQHTS
jgi:hypothetical protein